MSEPFVSVIIPVHNRIHFIEECIESVFNQTYQNFELIVIDDGSKDGVTDLIQKQYPQIILKTIQHSGVSKARNTGIELSQGEWITFLDSDDLWGKDKLKEQIIFFESNNDALICYTEEIWYRNNIRVNPCQHHSKHSGWIYEKILPLCLISPSSVMIHRSVFDELGLFDEDMQACEDYDLWLRIGSRYPIHLIQKPQIIKRNGHPGQLSATIWGQDRFRIKSLIKMLTSGDLNSIQQKITKEICEKKIKIYANGCRKRGKTEEALQYEQLLLSL